MAENQNPKKKSAYNPAACRRYYLAHKEVMNERSKKYIDENRVEWNRHRRKNRLIKTEKKLQTELKKIMAKLVKVQEKLLNYVDVKDRRFKENRNEA